MRILFQTLDGLKCVADCDDIDIGSSGAMRPMWDSAPVPGQPQPERFMQYRRYERTGEVVDGVPVFREATKNAGS